MASYFILTEAREEDCEAIANIEFEACSKDPGFSTIFPQGATPAVLEDYTRRFRGDLENDPTCHMYLIRDSYSNAVVSFATWHFFPERHQEEIDEQMLLNEFHLPQDANREAGNQLISNGLRKRHEIMGTKPYAFLAAVGTSLKWRKQGAASMLIEHGLFMSDRQSLPTYVEGTAVAASLYAKFGFAVVDELKLTLSPWKDGDFRNVCMVRPVQQDKHQVFEQ